MLGYLICKRIIFSAYNIWGKIIFFQAFFEWILITLILYFLISNIYLIIYVFGIWLIGSGFLPKKAKVKAENKYNPFSNGSRKNPRQTQNEKKTNKKNPPEKTNKQKNKYVLNDKNYIRIRVRVLHINLEWMQIHVIIQILKFFSGCMDIFITLGDGPSENTWNRSYYIKGPI